MSLLGNANDSVNLVKSALDAKVALGTAEEKEKLADAKLALADLKQIIADLKEGNQSLNQQLKEKDDYRLTRGVYWLKHDSEQNQPFCPVCYANERIVPLKKTWEGRPKEQSPWDCPNKECGALFNPWDHTEPPSAHVSSPDFFNSGTEI